MTPKHLVSTLSRRSLLTGNHGNHMLACRDVFVQEETGTGGCGQKRVLYQLQDGAHQWSSFLAHFFLLFEVLLECSFLNVQLMTSNSCTVIYLTI